ncbi:potassium channel family protein [Aureimonas jatrophae]|uniref:Voltage-gated potassium channel n=1 Tax=Aureimonas jatrophae TaxID=1166073 RepID=A0A1H0K3Y5_9HYPH|nr:potassium channel family protein [Aureimonas jatrophae]MBB3950932.1 voltage-gated potassium channel [Aureimonas jatrophae]SDO50567.1 voltage-gated potassium channel [Aureimonas jatrophae]
MTKIAAEPAESRFRRLRRRLDALYNSDHPKALRFQAAMAAIDVLIIAFFILSPLIENRRTFLWLDYAAALVVGLDLLARALVAPRLSRWLRRPTVWIDLLVLLTLVAPSYFFSLGFLRVLKIWTLSHKEVLWRPVRRSRWRAYEDAARALINLVTCLFVITGFVYTAFARPGSGVEGYVDALYFTVATVTTTGFGDITLPGVAGKLTSIVTMIVGISLFVRLAQAVFRPYKVFFRCPRCALERHEPDAVHCKACGHLLAIPDDGD